MATIDSINRDTTRLSDGPDWTFELLETYLAEVDRVAKLYRLDTYPHQIEVITSEQMMDAYSSVGMPINYPHWSFGKKFIETEQAYKHGQQGLAYEIVINSNPCIAYLMEENTITMQALVMAHACYGHNSFFKNNYLFRSWTDASSIIDYLIFARKYITECEERYGVDEVEKLLDSCHALMNYGVDRYKRPQKISLQEEKARQKSREEYLQSQVNMLWRTLPKREEEKAIETARRYPSEPQENLLYFMEKNAPLLESWQREILRIVRKVSQYFYPQKQTQVMNEGWATFWHYTILNHLYDEGKVTERFMLEFLHSTPTLSTSRPITASGTTGLTPTRWALPCSRILSAFVSRRPKRTNTGSRTSPAPTGWRRCILLCATSRMRALSASSCHRKLCVISASLRCSTTTITTTWRFRPSITRRDIGRFAPSFPPSTT
ncbi:SpoVR family protein [Raoultella terrigena]|uniref:SpoVR family protein n=1 Tax=Raoultella terrigena TaxID=577 RepID=A0A3P8JI54_RAOTE|nr:SpoVR family protein [Raoultella terrigena]